MTIKAVCGDEAISAEYDLKISRTEQQTQEEFLAIYPVGSTFELKREDVQ